MKTKIFGLALILFVLMLFACDDSGDVNNAASGNNAAQQGVVTITFDVERDEADAKAMSVDNPDLQNNLIYQYKAVADFKAADGSDPVGSTGDVWTELKKEISFAVGQWTFDARAIQKGSNYESDKNDFTIIYELAEPVKTLISADSIKHITFTVKKKIEGTGNVNVNIAISNPIVINEGALVVELCELTSGESYRWEEFKGEFNWETGKFCFKANVKDVASGFYVVNFVYLDFIEKYKYSLNSHVEVFNGKDTNIKGEIDLGSPSAIFFTTNEQSASLECELYMEKRIYSAKESIPVKIGGHLFSFVDQKELNVNKEKIVEAKKEYKAEKKAAVPVEQQAKKKVVANNEQFKQVKLEALNIEKLKEPLNLEQINEQLKPLITKTDVSEKTTFNYYVDVYTIKNNERINKEAVEIKPDDVDIKNCINTILKAQGSDPLKPGTQYKFVFTVRAQVDELVLKSDSDPIVVTLLKD